MDAPVMRIGFTEVADQYCGMQQMAMMTSQLSRGGGVARHKRQMVFVTEVVNNK